MEEFFIKCVQQYPCLWNTTLNSYKQLDVKDKAWKEILQKTNMDSVSRAKTKWKNLRDTHREKLKKISKSSKNVKPWKFMRHMEFLVPYITERDTNAQSPHPDILTSLEVTVGSQDNTDYSLVETKTEKRDTDEMDHDEEESLPDYLKEINANRGAQNNEIGNEVLTSDDPLKAFFDSMYQSTKQMPEFYQREIKKKLFQLVMEAEDDIANTNYSNNSHTPSTNQTNYGSEHNSTYSPEPSVSSVHQTQIGDKLAKKEFPKIWILPATRITPSDGTNTNTFIVPNKE